MLNAGSITPGENATLLDVASRGREIAGICDIRFLEALNGKSRTHPVERVPIVEERKVVHLGDRAHRWPHAVGAGGFGPLAGGQRET